jgi:hypothetical protein
MTTLRCPPRAVHAADRADLLPAAALTTADLLPASRADREGLAGLAVLAAMQAALEDLEEAQAGLVADKADLAPRPSR